MDFKNLIIGNQIKRQFDFLETKHLGIYIYALRDPRDNKIFYVGQGVNSRLFDHFKEAEDFLNGKGGATSKVLRIVDIWYSDEDVDWVILSHGLTKENSDLVETSILDALSESQNGQVLNAIAGPNSKLLTKDDLKAINAPPISPENRFSIVFIFPIHHAFARSEIYEATRKVWYITNNFRSRSDAYAVGLVASISIGSFKIEKWQDSIDNKHEFIGTKDEQLLNKNWHRIISGAKGYWQRGNYLIVEFDGNGRFRYLRGNPVKDWVEL